MTNKSNDINAILRDSTGKEIQAGRYWCKENPSSTPRPMEIVYTAGSLRFGAGKWLPTIERHMSEHSSEVLSRIPTYDEQIKLEQERDDYREFLKNKQELFNIHVKNNAMGSVLFDYGVTHRNDIIKILTKYSDNEPKE